MKEKLQIIAMFGTMAWNQPAVIEGQLDQLYSEIFDRQRVPMCSFGAAQGQRSLFAIPATMYPNIIYV